MSEEACVTYVFFSCWLENQMYTHEVQHRRDKNHKWWLEATWEVVEASVYREGKRVESRERFELLVKLEIE